MFPKSSLLVGALLCAFPVLSSGADAKYPFDLTTISSPDGSVTAKFVSLGATMAELWVKDKYGKARDVVLGYDDNSKLLTDPVHPYFGGIVGRYANRIKNGTFSVPITKDPQPDGPNVYHIPTNEHNGEDTLHGGILGWDRRNWVVATKSKTSVTYVHVDTGDEGFPGIVTVLATYTVSNHGELNAKIRAFATQKTPIMATQHIYWNLNAFQGSSTILDHHFQLDASRVIEVDGDLIPTGKFINATGTPFDFTKATTIGARINQTVGLCGGPCQGYDHDWILNKDHSKTPGISVWSELSGIRVDITTNQPAVQVYSSFGLNVPRKVIHGGPNTNYSRFGALVIEQQSYIDAINTPEFGVDQIYGPGKDFFWESTYKFSTVS